LIEADVQKVINEWFLIGPAALCC